MANIIEWVDGKNTRLRIIAGLSVIFVWVIFSLVYLIAWLFGKDLTQYGALNFFNSISLSVGGIVGTHMVTKPGGNK